MRGEGLACQYVVAFLQTNRFIDEPQCNPSVKIQLPYATDNSTEIIQAAIAGLDQMCQEGYRYKKGGVMVGGLIPISERQTSLLDPYDREEVANLMQALDSVNTLFGPETVRFGAHGLRQSKWQMRQNHLSTTNNRGWMMDHQQTRWICELGQSTHPDPGIVKAANRKKGVSIYRSG